MVTHKNLSQILKKPLSLTIVHPTQKTSQKEDYLIGDPLTALQNSGLLPTAIGKQIAVSPTSWDAIANKLLGPLFGGYRRHKIKTIRNAFIK